MSTVPLTDQRSVRDLADRLAGAPWISLDTEFLRERTYRPQLCLLQLALPREALCVDPLADIDLESLRPALAGGALILAATFVKNFLDLRPPRARRD